MRRRYLPRDDPEPAAGRRAARVVLPSDVQAYEAAVAAGLPAAVPADWDAATSGWPATAAARELPATAAGGPVLPLRVPAASARPGV